MRCFLFFFFILRTREIFSSHWLQFKTLIKHFLNLMDASGSQCLLNCYHSNSSLKCTDVTLVKDKNHFLAFEHWSLNATRTQPREARQTQCREMSWIKA